MRASRFYFAQKGKKKKKRKIFLAKNITNSKFRLVGLCLFLIALFTYTYCKGLCHKMARVLILGATGFIGRYAFLMYVLVYQY